ncbi:MAG: glutamate--tRNA ligase family protein [Sphingobacteriaceae bacterium]|nr:glutamate--tRNA ligase family protein [Sphingobacteriaceae bacterium]
MKPLQTRLAPTPSGFLHLGNVFAFLVTAVEAKRRGLELRLRIDDLDRTRFRQAYLEDVFAVLEVLGIDWQHGPHSATEFIADYRQELRLSLYENYLERLRATGQVYACGCSRAEMAAHGHNSAACLAQKLPLDDPGYAWRLRLERGTTVCLFDFEGQSKLEVLGKEVVDPVVRRKQERPGAAALPAYHLACVADDVLYGTTHVVRGVDLYESSLIQRYMAEILQEKGFLELRFLHHDLVQGPTGQKLSKSAGDAKAHSLLDAYPDSGPLYGALGTALGANLKDLSDFEAWWLARN